jgi:hypothetical protein
MSAANTTGAIALMIFFLAAAAAVRVSRCTSIGLMEI